MVLRKVIPLLARRPAVQRNLRVTLASLAAIQWLLVVVLLVAGASQLATVVAIAGWAFAAGAVPVGWSTWLTRTIPHQAESGGGILVAAIQGSMLAGAVVGGAAIDGRGPLAPLVASAVILLVGSVHTFLALRDRKAV